MVHGSVVCQLDRTSNVEGSNPMSATAKKQKKTNPKLDPTNFTITITITPTLTPHSAEEARRKTSSVNSIRL